MSEPIANPAPFSGRGALALVVVGILAFLAMLYGFSASVGGSANDGNAHAGGKGLTGYAGLYALLENDGFAMMRVRDPSRLAQPGLLVLTPPADADGAKIERIVAARRTIGPTLVILPKWVATRSQSFTAKRGWVVLRNASPPQWKGFHDDIAVELGKPTAPGRTWHGGGFAGTLPPAMAMASASGPHLVPLVTTAEGKLLAAFVGDSGEYDSLYDFAGAPRSGGGSDRDVYPLVFVFEPDLLNNWGMADQRAALMARDLVLAASGGTRLPVWFDLTLNGFGHSRSLVDLAFRPPYLAATLCLILAALATGWRAFLRFGPPHARGREIALGKTALVDNSAGLIRRARRLGLVAAPYAALLRERIGQALKLPRGLDPAEAEAAIDRAVARRDPTLPAFSATAEALRQARGAHDLARQARTLQSIEKALT